jgi:hypothetical protein
LNLFRVPLTRLRQRESDVDDDDDVASKTTTTHDTTCGSL